MTKKRQARRYPSYLQLVNSSEILSAEAAGDLDLATSIEDRETAADILSTHNQSPKIKSEAAEIYKAASQEAEARKSALGIEPVSTRSADAQNPFVHPSSEHVR